jgi:hypothetical protein
MNGLQEKPFAGDSKEKDKEQGDFAH